MSTFSAILKKAHRERTKEIQGFKDDAAKAALLIKKIYIELHGSPDEYENFHGVNLDDKGITFRHLGSPVIMIKIMPYHDHALVLSNEDMLGPSVRTVKEAITAIAVVIARKETPYSESY